MKIGKITVYTALVALFAVVLITPAGSEQKEPTTADRLNGYVSALASGEMAGRLPGTEGNLKAAEYIVNMFRTFGLAQAGSSYKQEFNYVYGLKAESTSTLSFDCLIEKPGVPKEMWKVLPRAWQQGKEWIALEFSAGGSGSSPLVFVGFGITAPDLKYDDYQGVDVKDKFVVVLTDAPYDLKKYKSKYDKKTYEDFKEYAFLPHKLKNAKDHGAKGIILVKVQSDSADVLEPIAPTTELLNSGLVCILATRTDAAKLFPRERQMFPSEEAINTTRKPNSFLMDNATLKYDVKMSENVIPIPNVVGMVKGTDPALSGEYLLVTSHFDHIGRGTEQGRFTYSSRVFFTFRGADDDASGVAAMLELAQRIGANPLKRTVVFVAFNAEEGKLLGSGYYVKNPVVPLDRTVGVINLDMIGRMKGKLNVNSIETFNDYQSLFSLKTGTDSIAVVQNPNVPEPSSHQPFLALKKPAMVFFTDPHEDIHTKNDTPEKLRYNEMARIVNYLEAVLQKLGN